MASWATLHWPGSLSSYRGGYGFRQRESSDSIFGSLSWNASSQLKVSAGLRGSWVHKSYDWNLFYGTGTQEFGGVVPLPAAVAALPAALGLGVPGQFHGARNDSDWMPSA